MTQVRILLSICITAAALALSACGGEEAKEPPPPPKIYIITHYNHDMEVVKTYRATFMYAQGGQCIVFQPEIHRSGDRYSVVCGNADARPEIAPTPQAADTSGGDKEPPRIYIVTQFKPDGTVFNTHRSTFGYAGENGCIYFMPEFQVNGRYSIVCGMASILPEPQ